MRLFIAEKPSLAQSIAEALASKYGTRVKRADNCFEVGGDVVAYCVGHILREAEPHEYDPAWERWNMGDLPMIPASFKLIPDGSKRDIIKTIKERSKDADEVVHAGDPDREGQAIVNNVLNHIGNKKPVKRIWLKELNIPGVLKALGAMKPNSAYDTLFDAARARTEADWGIGMNTTRAYSLVWSAKTGLRGREGVIHVGRVTTPTLGLVVARDLEIENFVPKDYFTLKIECAHANGTFWASWQAPTGAPFLDEEGHVKDRKVVEAVAAKVKGKPGSIATLKTEPKRQAAPLPFSLSELQKTASKFGLSPARTLEVAQSLYERHKLTSYPRSDCPYLPEAEWVEAKQHLAAAHANFKTVGGWPFAGKPDFTIKSRAWDDKKLGAHSGIIPTTQHADLSKLTPHELLIYRLVVRNFLAQFYPAYEYQSTVVTVACEGETFKATGKVETAAGWKVLFRAAATNAEAAEKDEEDEDGPLPAMKQGDATVTRKVEVKDEKTKPPPRYDGGSLVEAMKNAHKFVTDPEVKKRLRDTEGIGTEATRAAIIDNLVKRGYIDEIRSGKKSYYMSTDKGRLTIRVLPPEITKVDLTAWFEGQLEKIVEGTLTIDAFRGSLHRFETKLIADAKSGKVAANMPTLAECAPKQMPPGATVARKAVGGKRLPKSTRAAPRAHKTSLGGGVTVEMHRPNAKLSRELHAAGIDPDEYAREGTAWVSTADLYEDPEDMPPRSPPKRAAAKRPPARRAAAKSNGHAAGGGKKCPKCSKPMALRARKSDGGQFWGCTGYPDCKHAENA